MKKILLAILFFVVALFAQDEEKLVDVSVDVIDSTSAKVTFVTLKDHSYLYEHWFVADHLFQLEKERFFDKTNRKEENCN